MNDTSANGTEFKMYNETGLREYGLSEGEYVEYFVASTVPNKTHTGEEQGMKGYNGAGLNEGHKLTWGERDAWWTYVWCYETVYNDQIFLPN